MKIFEIAFGLFGLFAAVFGIRVLGVMLKRGMRRSAILCGVFLVLAGAVPLVALLVTGRKPLNLLFGFGIGGCVAIGLVAIVSGVRGRAWGSADK